MKPEDMADAMRMFQLTYGTDHDKKAVREWFLAKMQDPDFLLLIGEGAACVGCISNTFYRPKVWKCYSIFLFGDDRVKANPFLPLKLERHLLSWGRLQGAKSFHLSSERGQADLSPIAKRLGMVPEPPGFSMEFQ